MPIMKGVSRKPRIKRIIPMTEYSFGLYKALKILVMFITQLYNSDFLETKRDNRL